MASKLSSRRRGLHLIRHIAGITEAQEYDSSASVWVARNGQMTFVLQEVVTERVVSCKFHVSGTLIGTGYFDFYTGAPVDGLKK